MLRFLLTTDYGRPTIDYRLVPLPARVTGWTSVSLRKRPRPGRWLGR